jgi:anthranilate synthase component I
MKLIVNSRKMLSDLFTPVSLFLKFRDKYSSISLLESSEYASKQGSYSFLAFDEIISLEIKDFQVNLHEKEKAPTSYRLINDIVVEINDFIDRFEFQDNPSKFNGLFGYTGYEGIKYFEKGSYNNKKSPFEIPDLKYTLYRYIIVFDHFNQSLEILENLKNDEESRIEEVITFINKQDHPIYSHDVNIKEVSNLTDEEFIDMVNTCKNHCKRGDVFQIVPSRRFEYDYTGDEFNIYRNLRSINPSPYLFYFDYSSYRVFGSSPEAQIIVKNNEAEVHPIAGTIKRNLDDAAKDAANTHQLLNDPKENAEHIMLVDLARNDLSKNTEKVHVASFKEVQYFSHVIHLVSKIKGTLKKGVSAFQVFADTFPQGTLSGAPKIKAIEIIERLEPNHRGLYGGAVGILGFDNSLNHAIIIRSIVSINQKLYLQAGAGVVIDSQAEFELKEVNNKLGALKKALL